MDRSKRNCELGNFLQGCDKFGIGGGESRRESAVGCGECCQRGAINGSVSGQVGDGVNSVLFIGMIGGLKSCAVRGYETLVPLLMGGDEEGFKGGTGIDVRGLDLPYFKVVEKQPCLKNELESDAYDLLRRVGRVDRYCVFDGNLYLTDECFNGVVGIVGGA